MVCTEINSHMAKQAVTSLCNKDVGLAVYLHHWRQTHVFFWATFHLFAAMNSIGIEETGYSDFQQLEVLHRLYAVSELSYVPLHPFSTQITTSTSLLLSLEEKFRI